MFSSCLYLRTIHISSLKRFVKQLRRLGNVLLLGNVSLLGNVLLWSIQTIENLPTAQGAKRRRVMRVRETRQYLLVEETAMTMNGKIVPNGLVMSHANIQYHTFWPSFLKMFNGR